MTETISSLLKQSHLKDSFENELLLAHVLQVSRSYLYTWPEKPVENELQQQFHALVKRRVHGEPIAYIIGEKEFYSLNLVVNSHTLIPRPETELLVECALAHIPTNTSFHLADLGTGSGAIALAIAKERPHCTVYAVDISLEALKVAKENQKRLNIANVFFLQAHWLKAFEKECLDMVVSNPPYIPEKDQHLKEGDLRFEPTQALSSGVTGLRDIEEILTQVRGVLRPNGWLWLEHGYDQKDSVQRIFDQNNYRNTINFQDISGNPRISGGKLSK